MEKEITPICQQCRWFDKGQCTMHHIEVCYNDEACCSDFIEKETEDKTGKE